MSEAEQIAQQISFALPNIKRGTLRFWGVWFGRPYDNLHRVVAVEAEGEVLRLRFHQDEQLTVWHPNGFQLDSSAFEIKNADRVLWEWFGYDRPKTQANRFFKDFVKTGQAVVASANVNWSVPDLKTDRSLPAVEMLSLTVDSAPRDALC